MKGFTELISAQDKVSIMAEYSNIKAEKSTTIERAELYKVPTAEYEHSHSSLMAYLEVVLSDLKSDSQANDREWTKNFMHYYEARAALTGVTKENSENKANA